MVFALTFGFTELGYYYIVTQCYSEHYEIHIIIQFKCSVYEHVAKLHTQCAV